MIKDVITHKKGAGRGFSPYLVKDQLAKTIRDTLVAGAVGELSVPIVAIYPLSQRLPSHTHAPRFGSSSREELCIVATWSPL